MPLQADGYFFEPLWTNWRVGPSPGILDWYTMIGGATALVALALHGATFIALKTSADLNVRARRLVLRLWPLLLALTAVSLLATIDVRPALLDNYRAHAAALAIPAMVMASLVALRYYMSTGHELGAFLSSSTFLAAMLAGAAEALYPNLLLDSGSQARHLTIFNSATGRYAMTVGLVWWSGGIAMAIAYFVFVYRMARGKLSQP